MLFLTNDSRFRNGKSILLHCRQLRLITTLLKFERQFSGQLRITGTNYEPSEAALIRGAGTTSRRPASWSKAPVFLTHPRAWVTPMRGGFRGLDVSLEEDCCVEPLHGHVCVFGGGTAHF